VYCWIILLQKSLDMGEELPLPLYLWRRFLLFVFQVLLHHLLILSTTFEFEFVYLPLAITLLSIGTTTFNDATHRLLFRLFVQTLAYIVFGETT
jgi:hypothetical protein